MRRPVLLLLSLLCAVALVSDPLVVAQTPSPTPTFPPASGQPLSGRAADAFKCERKATKRFQKAAKKASKQFKKGRLDAAGFEQAAAAAAQQLSTQGA